MPTIYTSKPLPARIDKDFYPTPHHVIDAAMARFGQRQAQVILDVGAGDGRWGWAAANYALNPLVVVGVDIRSLPKPEGFTFWHTLDYARPIECEMMAVKEYDWIVGNPPFYCLEDIVWQAWRQLKPGGRILFLAYNTFWYSSSRFNYLWRVLPPIEKLSIVNRVPFTGPSNPNLCVVFEWGKDADGRPMGKANETRNTQIEV